MHIEKTKSKLKNIESYSNRYLIKKLLTDILNMDKIIRYLDKENIQGMSNENMSLSDFVNQRAKMIIGKWLSNYFSEEKIASYDVICFSVTYEAQLINSLYFAKLIKEVFPNKKIVFGGNLMTFYQKEIYADKIFWKYMDYCIFFQGENALVDLFNWLNTDMHSKLENVAYISNDKITYIKNIKKFESAFVTPDYSDINFELNKGVDAEQNIKFLRYAKSVGLLIGWNLLTEIPNDSAVDWKAFLDIIPLIYHLNPPLLVRPLEIVRFSPYYEHPERYGITDVTPSNVYNEILPADADVSKLAWLFTANYKSESREDKRLSTTIRKKVQLWMELWKKGKSNIPVLRILKKDERFFLEDSRYGNLMRENITKQQAKMALFGLLSKELDELNWGIEKKVVVCYENKYIPLATANPRIFEELEDE